MAKTKGARPRLADKKLEEDWRYLQDYFKRNILDLRIPDMVQKLSEIPGKTYRPLVKRTACLNYISESCPVSHQSIYVRRMAGVTMYDDIEEFDFYVCDKTWFVNFSGSPIEGIGCNIDEKETLAEKRKESEMLRQLMKEGKVEEAWLLKERSGLRRVMDPRAGWLGVVGSKSLFPVAKPLHLSTHSLSSVIEAYLNRGFSLYDPQLGNNMLVQRFHEPKPNPVYTHLYGNPNS
jgi:hypothetical protein